MLALSGKKKIVYVADGWEGVRIIDVSDPYQPNEISLIKTPGWAFHVAISGEKAFVAGAFAGLRVVDISDPKQAYETGSFAMKDGHAHRVFIEGNMAYIADRFAGLRVVDVSDSANATQAGIYAAIPYVRDVSIKENYAYLAVGPGSIWIVDISKPNRLQKLASCEVAVFVWSIAVGKEYIYVSAGHVDVERSGLHIIDVKDPFHPVKVGFISSGWGRDITLQGNTVYVVDESDLRLIDISDPFNPVEIGNLNFADPSIGRPLGIPIGVAVSGSYAYLCTSWTGLQIVDISDPTELKVIGSCSELEFSQEVVVDKGTAYVADTSGLGIIDVSRPKKPKLLAYVPIPGFAESVTIFNKIAYVSCGGGGIWAVGVSNPSKPVSLGYFDTSGYGHEVDADGKNVYLADGEGGLAIFNPPQNVSVTQTMNLDFFPPSAPSKSKSASYQNICLPRLSSLSSHASLKTKIHKNKSPEISGNNILNPSMRNGSYLTVTTAKDSGTGSLRWALENAKPNDTITFDPSVFPPENPTVIKPKSELPNLSQGHLTINASNAGVVLDGSLLSGWESGLRIDSDKNTIMGLEIIQFPDHGINICNGARDNIIGGNRNIGSGPAGQGNIISKNGNCGISISDVDTTNNVTIGNLIGTDSSGKKARGNRSHGVFIFDSSDNTIGSSIPDKRNIISANGNGGVAIQRKNARGNRIIGNYIGTDITGTSDLGNEGAGVYLELGTFDNVVKNNVISGNNYRGIVLNDWGSSYNRVVGNLIGLDKTGSLAIKNEQSGILIGMGAGFNLIGGTKSYERNVISGNVGSGIMFGRQGMTGNTVIGNHIGTNKDGTKAVPNGDGVVLGDGSRRPFIGGLSKEERNVISGNNFSGLKFAQVTDSIFIGGNYVGTDASGKKSIPNNWGLNLDWSSKNTICANLISGNKEGGIFIGEESNDNKIASNIVKINPIGLNAIANYNSIYRNKFLNNNNQATDSGKNNWDRETIGNYWSDYTGTDANSDGIGDTPYKILPNGVDHYPLMKPSHKLIVKIDPKKSGKVTRIPKKSRYEMRENVCLEAMPAKGYVFSSWSGDVLSGQKTKNPLVLTMNTDKSITANFIPKGSSYISVSKKFLNFGAVINGEKTPDQMFRVMNTGSEMLEWLITDNADWLSCSHTSGKGNALITVSVNPSGLFVGTYTATIYVSSFNSKLSHSFQTITVNLEVMSPSEAGVPFGEWDKPVESPSYKGGFPFSGWSLDRIGIESVKIYRLKVASDDSLMPEEIYVGDAFFVEGARPDVEVLYPSFPQCDLAGWGYNLVSDILPGDGLYSFIVRVRSMSGVEVELGKRKIDINNSSSFSPFGTIDFPEPGGRVSGNSFHVTGWGLMKGQTHISEVGLYIDSEYKKTMDLGYPRLDILSLLPGYTGSKFCGFMATIDPSSLSNEYHSVFLSAEDNEGRKSVLGSRWFYKGNGEEMNGIKNQEGNRIQKGMGVAGRKDYGREIEQKQRKKIEFIDEKVEIRINELKNMVIRGFGAEGEDITYKALYKGKEILPLGMSFNGKRGIISWLPMPGFKGEFPIEILKFENSILIGKKRIVFHVK